DLVRELTGGNGCVLGNTNRSVFSALLDDGVLQFHHSVSDSFYQEAADDHRCCHRILHDRRRHVARTISDCCSFAGNEVLPVYVELLSAATGGDSDHRRHFCRDGPALYAVCESGSHYFDLGVEGRRARSTRPDDSRGRRRAARALEDQAMSAIYGLYSDPDAAQYAVDQLRKAGIADRAITVITSQPYEEYEFSHRYKPTWIFWIAAGGGLLGLCAGLTLAYVTETFWPIVTGGMPIVAWWPNIIILFELTMLGAILATVVSLFVTAELPNTRSKVYDT